MKYAGPADTEEFIAGEAEDAESAFPVPPLDLPHYHGVGLDAEAGLEAGASPSDTSPKEVTGA